MLLKNTWVLSVNTSVTRGCEGWVLSNNTTPVVGVWGRFEKAAENSGVGNLNEKVKTRRPSLQVLFIALQNRSGALVTAEFVRTIMLICWGFFLAKPLCFILFSQQFYEYHMTCRYNLSLSPFHGRENWGVEKLFTQGQTTSTWLSWDSSPNCLTGRASIFHNGCLVVLSEIGNHGFHFQGGLIWVNSLFACSSQLLCLPRRMNLTEVVTV